MKTILALLCLVALITACPSENGLACDVCVGFIVGVEKAFRDGEGAEIREADQFCEKLTRGTALFDAICKSLAHNFIEEIIEKLKNLDTPEMVCERIHLC
uniref:Saposin B-type domain-containing protein n=1 Tax=Steinernema glaseri TaxID=37863 RepID=A0A1I7Z517_9BILA